MKDMNCRLLLGLICFLFGEQLMAQQDLSWEQLEQQYQFPQWYTDARFGIWVTIGPQSQPELGGGWYARHMFMEVSVPSSSVKMPIIIIEKRMVLSLKKDIQK